MCHIIYHENLLNVFPYCVFTGFSVYIIKSVCLYTGRALLSGGPLCYPYRCRSESEYQGCSAENQTMDLDITTGRRANNWTTLCLDISVLRIRIRDPVSGMGKKSGSGSGIRIRDEQPGSYFWELKKKHFFGLKYLNSFMWIRDPVSPIYCDKLCPYVL